MIVSKEEALDKWCPHARVSLLNVCTHDVVQNFNITVNRGINDGFKCIADKCMMWKWADGSKFPATYGYCGLVNYLQD